MVLINKLLAWASLRRARAGADRVYLRWFENVGDTLPADANAQVIITNRESLEPGRMFIVPLMAKGAAMKAEICQIVGVHGVRIEVIRGAAGSPINEIPAGQPMRLLS